MKIVYLVFILVFLSSCTTSFKIIEKSSDYSLIVKSRKYKGVVFLKNANCFMCLQEKNKFSPSLIDIETAEKILKNGIRDINKPLTNQADRCPTIHKNLQNYRRQYFGYTDENGDKIIFINFIWSRYTIFDRMKGEIKNEGEKWKSERIFVLDGGSFYWEIKINLDKENLFDFYVNGIA